MGLTRRREIADEFEHHLKYALEEGETSRYTKGKNMCAYIYEIRIFLGQFSKQFCALLTYPVGVHGDRGRGVLLMSIPHLSQACRDHITQS